jgi:hypothetical protein
VDLGKAASWATIIGIPIALVTGVISVLTIPEAHDYFFHNILHKHDVVQQNSAQGNRPVDPKRKSIRYEDHDVCTNVKYTKTLSFDKFEHVNPNKVRGGDSHTPGREVVVEWTAPGPVTSVSGKCLVGGCVIESCSPAGNVAHCEGWTNDGNHGTINMDVAWVQAQPDHC